MEPHLQPIRAWTRTAAWQTLQLHLRSALAAREAGDITLALQEVDAALSIDPDYLAARLLRESLADRQPPLSPRQKLPDQATPSQLEPQPPDIASARTAIHLSRFAEARDALEVVEFDPAWPVIPEIAAELQPARDRVKRRHPMLFVAVASGVAGLIVGTLAGLATRPHRELATADAAPAAPLSGSPTFSVPPPVIAPRLSAELLEPAASAAIAQDAIVPSRTDSLPSPPAAAPPPRARIETPPPAAERISAVAVAERPSPASSAYRHHRHHRRPRLNVRPRRLLRLNGCPKHRRRSVLAWIGLRMHRRSPPQTTRR